MFVSFVIRCSRALLTAAFDHAAGRSPKFEGAPGILYRRSVSATESASLALLLVLGLVTYVPAVSLWLPNLVVALDSLRENDDRDEDDEEDEE